MVKCKKYKGVSFKRGVESFNSAVENNYKLYINSKFNSEVYLTPQNIFEAILGFLYTHGAIRCLDEVESIYVEDNNIKVKLSSSAPNVYLEKDFKIPSKNKLDMYFIRHALEEVDRKLGKIKEGCSFHIAKLITWTGEEFYAYDTSRHILIDKLIGKGLINNVNFNESLIITTARLSRGIVYKAIISKIPCMISLRGPISSGIELARKYDLIYISHIRGRGFVIFSGFDRVGWDNEVSLL